MIKIDNGLILKPLPMVDFYKRKATGGYFRNEYMVWDDETKSFIYLDRKTGDALNQQGQYLAKLTSFAYFYDVINKKVDLMRVPKPISNIIISSDYSEEPPFKDFRNNYCIAVRSENRGPYPDYSKSVVIEKEWIKDTPITDIQDSKAWMDFILQPYTRMETYLKNSIVETNPQKFLNYLEKKNINRNFVNEVKAKHRDKMIDDLLTNEMNDELF